MTQMTGGHVELFEADDLDAAQDLLTRICRNGRTSRGRLWNAKPPSRSLGFSIASCGPSEIHLQHVRD